MNVGTLSRPVARAAPSYQNIPADLRALRQWVAADTDKAPINPRTGQHASVADPGTWATFEEARAAGHPHIGFVFTAGDPFCGIDLDCKTGSESERQRIETVLGMFDSYTERSVSGNGYHILVRSKLEAGRRRDNVEVYSSGRYFICTGDVHKALPITDCQPALNRLIADMPKVADVSDIPDARETHSDEYVMATAERATNGDKFRALCAGRWEELGYLSQSEADHALLAMFCFYSRNTEQVRRLFRATALGQRNKAQRRNDYLDRSIARVRSEQAKDAAIIARIKEDVASWSAQADAERKAKRWLVPASELRTKRKPCAWLIKNVLQADALAMVHGPSGAGKTFLALDWAMCIATDKPDWQGHRVKPGSVVYLAGEGHTGLGQRCTAWAVHNSTTELTERMVVSRSACELDAPNVLASVIEQVRECGAPSLIVVDTLHRFMSGDENTAKDAGRMVAACDRLKREFGCAVLLVHHTGVAAEAQHRARGSSAWRGALDVEIGVQPPPAGESSIVVSILKMRDDEPGPPVFVKLQRVDLPGWVDDDGEQVTSAVLVESDGSPLLGRRPTPVDEKKNLWQKAWLADGSVLSLGDHSAPYLSRTSFAEWLEKNTKRTPSTIGLYLRPSTKSGFIRALLEQRWIEAHGDGWVCLDAADSSTLLMTRNLDVSRPKKQVRSETHKN